MMRGYFWVKSLRGFDARKERAIPPCPRSRASGCIRILGALQGSLKRSRRFGAGDRRGETRQGMGCGFGLASRAAARESAYPSALS